MGRSQRALVMPLQHRSLLVTTLLTWYMKNVPTLLMSSGYSDTLLLESFQSSSDNRELFGVVPVEYHS
jgi:hypothetical protein